MKKFIFILLGCAALSIPLASQNMGVKTNFLHWATGVTPNAGIEFGLNRKYTLEIGGGFNKFNLFKDNAKAYHWIVQPELRYWICETFNGHFFGLHALVSEFNVGGIDIPLGRLADLKDFRYEGYAYGAGLSWGYQWPIARRWNFEVNLGAGYAYLDYDKYPCVKCGSKLESTTENYFGVTKAAVSLIYLIK